ncbi:MAG: excisionase [Alphaproteobacteria bacterium]
MAEMADGQHEPLTYSIPEAGAMVGLSRNGAYEAAKRGEIPTLSFGRLLRVPGVKWRRIVAGEGEAA